MRILVTGYHGFVGQNLIPYLKEQGHGVYGLGRVGDYTWTDLDEGKMPEVDAVIHLAGKAHDTRNRTEADVYFHVNRDLTVKVYDWFLKSTARKFVFFSSVKAAADKVVDKELTETVTPAPKGPYGESKLEAEKYLLSHAGKCTYILRPCMMHGKGNKGNLNLLYKMVRTGLPWPLGAFENRRSFASIGNVCYVVSELLTRSDVPAGIYNLADDEALSTNELIETICEALHKKAHIWKFGRNLMTAVAHAGDKIHLPLNSERLAKLTENYVVSNHKIKQALHIDAMPQSTRDGLRLTIRSFD